MSKFLYRPVKIYSKEELQTGVGGATNAHPKKKYGDWVVGIGDLGTQGP